MVKADRSWKVMIRLASNIVRLLALFALVFAGVYDVLRKMEELKVPVSLGTLCDYVVPSLVSLNVSTDSIIAEVRQTGPNFFGIVNALVRHSLDTLRPDTAVDIREFIVANIKYYRIFCQKTFALKKTSDIFVENLF